MNDEKYKLLIQAMASVWGLSVSHFEVKSNEHVCHLSHSAAEDPHSFSWPVGFWNKIESTDFREAAREVFRAMGRIQRKMVGD